MTKDPLVGFVIHSAIPYLYNYTYARTIYDEMIRNICGDGIYRTYKAAIKAKYKGVDVPPVPPRLSKHDLIVLQKVVRNLRGKEGGHYKIIKFKNINGNSTAYVSRSGYSSPTHIEGTA